MSIFNRFRIYREQRAYERTVLWRQRNIPLGEMRAQTIVYQRRLESLSNEATQKQQAALQAMKAKIRTTFLSHPATTEADFERCWPILRDEVFMRHTLNNLEIEQDEALPEVVGTEN